MSKKLTYGVGYNSTGVYKTRENDNITRAYYSWSNMMQRCYSVKFQKKNLLISDVPLPMNGTTSRILQNGFITRRIVTNLML